MSETVIETWSNIKMNSATRSPSSPRTLRRVPQSLQRLDDLGLAGHGRLALFLFFLDDLFRRIGDEFLVAELGVDALDVGVGLGDLLVEPNFFGREINHALERQRCGFAADTDVHRAFGRGRGKGNLGKPRHALDDVAPALRTRLGL